MTLIEFFRLSLAVAKALLSITTELLPKDPKGEPIPNVDSQWAKHHILALSLVHAAEVKIRQYDQREANRDVYHDRRA